MKNIFYAILTLMCLTFNVSIASSSIENDKNLLQKSVLDNDLDEDMERKRPCNVYVEIQNSDGTFGKIRGDGGNLTWDDCGRYKDKYLSQLIEDNVKFEQDNVTVIWG